MYVYPPEHFRPDKPGPASISYEPQLVVKKHPLTITCFVLDPGRPKVTGFKWMRGWYRLPDENDATFEIESVNLETEANFTCMGYNEAGDGDPATMSIDVSGERHMSMRPKLRLAITELHSGNSGLWPTHIHTHTHTHGGYFRKQFEDRQLIYYILHTQRGRRYIYTARGKLDSEIRALRARAY